MIAGTVLSGIGGFYQVETEIGQRFNCRLRGKLRLSREGILVGDRVLLTAAATSGEGHIEEILPRDSEFPRPPLANVSQMLAVMAWAAPEPNLHLLDRILVLAEYHRIPAAVCFNKIDLIEFEAPEQQSILQRTAKWYRQFSLSAETGHGLSPLQDWLQQKITALAGPSGVGKSTLINALTPAARQHVGEISRKLRRGRHTTREVKLLPLSQGGFVADTPGFSQLSLGSISVDQLQHCFPDLAAAGQQCPFRGCTHTKEQECAVKTAALSGTLSSSRYESYLQFRQEITQSKRY